jgi:nitrilase
MGATERDTTNSSLYCSYFYFAPDGTYLGKHRKIKPTGTERIVWAEGSGDTLTVIDSEVGVFGGLICWENYMPLARYAFYRKGIEIYLAPTADARNEWQATMQHIALESRCFVIGCNQFITANDYPEYIKKEVEDVNDLHCRGGSVVYSPLGKPLAGPVFDKEALIIADIEKEAIIRAKMDFDVAGHYARDDIFQYEAKNQPAVIKHRIK